VQRSNRPDPERYPRRFLTPQELSRRPLRQRDRHDRPPPLAQPGQFHR